jgi:CheY-like chemotaxis protein
MLSMRILVVDDEEALADNMAEMLVVAGHRAAVSTSAEDALVRLRVDAESVDVLLTDYRLPGATGAELIRAARSLGSHIPALVITAYGNDDIVGAAIEAGASGVLEKPVDFQRVLSWLAGIAPRA